MCLLVLGFLRDDRVVRLLSAQQSRIGGIYCYGARTRESGTRLVVTVLELVENRGQLAV